MNTSTEPERQAKLFVGREHELGELLGRLDLARKGQGGVVLVSGESGIGKTRLVQEVADRALEQGGTVLWGRCWEPDMGAPAFWPWREALAACVRSIKADVLRAALGTGEPELIRLVPELRAIAADLTPEAQGESEDPQEAQFRLLRSVTEFLRQLASALRTETPPAGERSKRLSEPLLLVVLDDLQWADRASLLLLQYVARERSPMPFLVAGLYDDSALEKTPLKSTAWALHRELTVSSIRLQGLRAQDVRALVESRLGPQQRVQTHAIAQMLHQVTEGNALFVTEMVDHFKQDARALDRDWHAIQNIPGAGLLVMPANIREVMERRLARLSDDARQVLTTAAVIGRDFDPAILACVMSIDGEALDKALAEAEVAGMLVPVGHRDFGHAGVADRFRFRHTLLQKALYESVPARTRLRLHGLIAGVLESALNDGQHDHAPALAYHLGQIGDYQKVRRYGALAGERAEQATAWEDATNRYEAKADEFARQSPSGHQVDDTGTTLNPSELSERELEVLRLICAGLTNQQIADRLSISPNTVARHITHIFNKTHTSNRAEAVSYAHGRRLVSLAGD